MPETKMESDICERKRSNQWATNAKEEADFSCSVDVDRDKTHQETATTLSMLWEVQVGSLEFLCLMDSALSLGACCLYF